MSLSMESCDDVYTFLVFYDMVDREDILVFKKIDKSQFKEIVYLSLLLVAIVLLSVRNKAYIYIYIYIFFFHFEHVL